MSTKPSAQTIILAAILIIIGLVAVVVPWYILPICEAADQNSSGMTEMHKQSSGTIMKCGYTARAEIGVGALIVLLGLTLLIFPGRNSRRSGGVHAIGLGVVTILLPTVLIGVCSAPSAPCLVGTKPGLILLGTVTILIGAVLIFVRDSGASRISGDT